MRRRELAAMPGELDAVSVPGTPPNGSAGGHATPPLGGGGGSFTGSVAASDATDAPPRLFVDLRPFMDRAPTTVRCGPLPMRASLHVLLCPG